MNLHGSTKEKHFFPASRHILFLANIVARKVLKPLFKTGPAAGEWSQMVKCFPNPDAEAKTQMAEETVKMWASDREMHNVNVIM